jgi:hypothetical protein
MKVKGKFPRGMRMKAGTVASDRFQAEGRKEDHGKKLRSKVVGRQR